MSFGRIVDLRNNTTSDILIRDLGVTVPANASAVTTNLLRVTDFVSDNELDASHNLRTYMLASSILVNGLNGTGNGTAAHNLPLDESLDEISITTIDASTQEFLIQSVSGLSFSVKGGPINLNGAPLTVADATLALTNGTTNYVYIDTLGNITSNTTGYPTTGTPLYTVVTSGGSVSTISTTRSYINSPTGASGGATGNSVVAFGKAGNWGNAYLPSADGSTVSSDVSTDGFPRNMKIVGYFVGQNDAGAPNSFQIILREKSNLAVDKYTISKPAGPIVVYGWNNNGFTTFNAGERMSIFVKKNPNVGIDVKLRLWYAWND
jgi:hypothetical protein